MSYKSLESCINDLESNGHLIRIKEEIDPYLEMASLHLRVYEAQGPALLFENVKGSKFKAVSNLFGTLDRSKFIFRHQIEDVKRLIDLKINPVNALKQPFKNIGLIKTAWNALPKKVRNGPILRNTCNITDIPAIVNWKEDGGPFVTLPIVYTEDIEQLGVMNSNIGMYRIQLGGNDYVDNKEIGLHYQLHRGIGVHQTKSNNKGQPLKVSIMLGGPPSLTFSAVMPLPEGMAEVTFAGALGGRRFHYLNHNGYTLGADCDFVITGYVNPGENKPEGPFGDHLGYYSLKHPFPLMHVEKVYHKPNAIWPFTVVGRPPQEDTSFGALIHEITGNAIPNEIPGLKEVNAVDAAGVHPLLLAVGQERYTPYLNDTRPSEILTIANHIFGKGQMSLAKYLFICADAQNKISTHDIVKYFEFVFERIDFERDLHFYTKTSMDTLDYSGEGLNEGSKVVIAAAGEKKRELIKSSLNDLNLPLEFEGGKLCIPGVIAIKGPKYSNKEKAKQEYLSISTSLKNINNNNEQVALIVLCDDADFTSQTLNNWLWVTFTRSNPSTDISGVNEFINDKHWGCKGPFIIDARVKPHHAPALMLDPEVEKRTDRLMDKYFTNSK
jgi:4-hydroxy-3-polyprenylbenzoate decarboxylase